jgi:hypothetical protein
VSAIIDARVVIAIGSSGAGSRSRASFDEDGAER